MGLKQSSYITGWLLMCYIKALVVNYIFKKLIISEKFIRKKLFNNNFILINIIYHYNFLSDFITDFHCSCYSGSQNSIFCLYY